MQPCSNTSGIDNTYTVICVMSLNYFSCILIFATTGLFQLSKIVMNLTHYRNKIHHIRWKQLPPWQPPPSPSSSALMVIGHAATDCQKLIRVGKIIGCQKHKNVIIDKYNLVNLFVFRETCHHLLSQVPMWLIMACQC